jgi:hypothetical protein
MGGNSHERDLREMQHSRLTSSLAARTFNILFLDCVTLTMGCAGLIIIWLAALRCFWNIDDLSYNEGWNAYYQVAALRGDNVYPPPGAFIFNNYPPLSFIVIGTLARLGGDVVVIGRLISVGSVVVIAISSGIIVNNLSNRSGRSGIVAAVVCLAAFCVISPYQVGMNDPQLFGQAIMTIALAIYTRAPESSLNLFLTVLLMAIAGMVKHNIVAVPIAIAVDVALRSPRRAMLFLTFSILTLFCCALWMHAISDGRVWSSLMSPRVYSFLGAAKLARDFFASAFPLVLIGAIGVVGRMSNPGPRLVASYGFAALLVGGILGGGAGVDLNIYFDVMIASALAVGLLTDELVGRFRLSNRMPTAQNSKDVAATRQLTGNYDDRRYHRFHGTGRLVSRASMSFVGIPGASLAALLIVASLIGPASQDLYKFRALYRQDDKAARAFIDGTTYLHAHPGDAICGNPLLCFRAGKPFVFDVFNALQAELTGRITAGQVSNLMESGIVKTVQLKEIEADLLSGAELPNGPRVAPVILKEKVHHLRFYMEVGQIYRPDHRNAGSVFFVAR